MEKPYSEIGAAVQKCMEGITLQQLLDDYRAGFWAGCRTGRYADHRAICFTDCRNLYKSVYLAHTRAGARLRQQPYSFARSAPPSPAKENGCDTLQQFALRLPLHRTHFFLNANSQICMPFYGIHAILNILPGFLIAPANSNLRHTNKIYKSI